MKSSPKFKVAAGALGAFRDRRHRRVDLPARQRPGRDGHEQRHIVGPLHHHVHVVRRSVRRRPHRRLFGERVSCR